MGLTYWRCYQFRSEAWVDIPGDVEATHDVEGGVPGLDIAVCFVLLAVGTSVEKV